MSYITGADTAGLNGIEFLWYSDPAGKGVAITQDQIRFNALTLNASELSIKVKLVIGVNT